MSLSRCVYGICMCVCVSTARLGILIYDRDQTCSTKFLGVIPVQWRRKSPVKRTKTAAQHLFFDTGPLALYCSTGQYTTCCTRNPEFSSIAIVFYNFFINCFYRLHFISYVFPWYNNGKRGPSAPLLDCQKKRPLNLYVQKKSHELVIFPRGNQIVGQRLVSPYQQKVRTTK